MSIETQLREALSARADDVDGPAFDPYERVAGAVVTHRRRRRAAAVGTVAALAAVAVLVPSLVRGDDHRTTPAKHTQVVPGPSDPRWKSLSTWPLRGSLAKDTALVQAVADRFGTQHVLYAADLPTSRVVVGWDPEADTDGKLTMYSGPRGGSADTLALVSSDGGGLGDAVTIREHADTNSTLVVLARPGVTEAAVSASVQIGTDGSVTRDAFRPVDLTDGMYVGPLEGSPATLTRVRVGDAAAGRVSLMAPATEAPQVDQGSVCLNCKGEDFRVKAEAGMGAGVAINLGLRPQDVTTTTRYFGVIDPATAHRLWVGDTDVPGAVTRLMVTDSTLPGGQVLRSALVVVTAKDGSAASTIELATGVPIDAATAESHPFVVRSSGPETSTMSYEVFAPGAAKVRLVSPTSPTIYPPTEMLTLRNGTALATTPSWSDQSTPYEVEAYAADGSLLGRWPVDLPSEDVWTEGTRP
ncbi:hypothetical protein GCM10025782_09180 [Pedococcus ginsenosidimutans]|uniref:Uncharacterized protein n=1 Tax=Pedococcus ginsenosidimutans TaxID=490570 RepID=A0ABP8XVL5_9MICO